MFGATYATLDEAWGPSPQPTSTSPPFSSALSPTASALSNPYKDQQYQRQILDNAASVGITPREPQVLDAPSVKAYLATLYRDSGPVAVTSLLPAGYLRAPPRAPPPRSPAPSPSPSWRDRRDRRDPRDRRGGVLDDAIDSVRDMLDDPESVMILLLTAFGLYMITR